MKFHVAFAGYLCWFAIKYIGEANCRRRRRNAGNGNDGNIGFKFGNTAS